MKKNRFKVSGVDTSRFKKGQKLYLDPLEPAGLTTQVTSCELGTICKASKGTLIIKKSKNESL
jgi:hypothetical protein